MVDSIEARPDGKFNITYNETPFSSVNIVVDARDINSVVSLNNDDLGERDKENNVIAIHGHYD